MGWTGHIESSGMGLLLLLFAIGPTVFGGFSNGTAEGKPDLFRILACMPSYSSNYHQQQQQQQIQLEIQVKALWTNGRKLIVTRWLLERTWNRRVSLGVTCQSWRGVAPQQQMTPGWSPRNLHSISNCYWEGMPHPRDLKKSPSILPTKTHTHNGFLKITPLKKTRKTADIFSQPPYVFETTLVSENHVCLSLQAWYHGFYPCGCDPVGLTCPRK